VGGVAAWAGTWTWYFLDPSIDGLVGTEVAEVTVPGSDTATLESGTYTIYHDVDGCESGPDACGLAEVTLRPANGEPPIELRATGSSHDTILGTGVYDLEIDDPGGYRLEAVGEPGVITLARGPLLDPGPAWLFLLKLLGGPALFLIGLCAAGLLHGQEPSSPP
jgi:hypothetical protein